MVVFWQNPSFAVCLHGGQVAWCGFWLKWLRWLLFQLGVGLGNGRRGIVVLEPIGVLWLGTPDGVALWDEEVGVGVQGPGGKLLVSTFKA